MNSIQETVLTDIASSAAEIRIPVPVAGHGLLYAFFVKQYEGTLSGFTADLYSLEGACPPNYQLPNEKDISDPPASTTLPTDVFKVLDTLTVSAASSLAQFREASGVPYVTNSNANSSGLRIDELYLKITPTSPALSKKFCVRIVYQENG